MERKENKRKKKDNLRSHTEEKAIQILHNKKSNTDLKKKKKKKKKKNLFIHQNSQVENSVALDILVWFGFMACHPSFVYAELNDQTVLFLTTQFSISHFLRTV